MRHVLRCLTGYRLFRLLTGVLGLIVLSGLGLLVAQHYVLSTLLVIGGVLLHHLALRALFR